jgi:thiol-disulfide isomerase/thioredoxin
MTKTASSTELSPARSRQVMMAFAFAIFALIGVAIFSLSKLSHTPWNSALKDPVIQDTLRQALPQFQHEELSRALTPSGGAPRWSLLTFWTVTCGPCLEELPAQNALAGSWQGPSFQILTVNLDADNAENLDNARRLLQEEQITLPTFYDKGGNLKNAFQVNEYPRHFLISPEGQIVWQATGAFKWNEASARDQLLKLMEKQTPEAAEDPAE